MSADEGVLVEGSGGSPLAAALAAFQSEVPSVVKGATATVQTKAGGQYQYSYADLASITPLVLPLLGKHGLAWSTQPTLMGENFILHYSLTHASGEAIEGIYPLPDPQAGTPQEIGSAITFARRYALCAVTGVAPGGDDDDAVAANDKPAASKSRRKPVPQAAPEPPVASQDWAARILDVDSVADLKAVYLAVEDVGELGARFGSDHAKALSAVVEHFTLPTPPAGMTVGMLINGVRGALTSAAAPADALEPAVEGGPVTEWPTATPGAGKPAGGESE